jgi:hypothetical protein
MVVLMVLHFCTNWVLKPFLACVMFCMTCFLPFPSSVLNYFHVIKFGRWKSYGQRIIFALCACPCLCVWTRWHDILIWPYSFPTIPHSIHMTGWKPDKCLLGKFVVEVEFFWPARSSAGQSEWEVEGLQQRWVVLTFLREHSGYLKG